MMTFSSFMVLFCSVLLLCRTVKALHEQKSDKKRKAHPLRKRDFARLADEFGR